MIEARARSRSGRHGERIPLHRDASRVERVFPVWAREGGPAAFAARLKDPAVRAKIKADKDFQHVGQGTRLVGRHRHGPRRQSGEPQQVRGKRISEIAKLRGDADPADTCLMLMAEDGGRHQRECSTRCRRKTSAR